MFDGIMNRSFTTAIIAYENYRIIRYIIICSKIKF